MKSFLGHFYIDLAIFSGHTARDPQNALASLGKLE